MKKSIFVKAGLVVFISLLFYFSKAQGVLANTKNQATDNSIHVTIDVDYYKRVLSPKHSVDMYVDGEYKSSFNCGERAFYHTTMNKGKHTVAFCKKGGTYWDDGTNSVAFKGYNDCLLSVRISGAAMGAKFQSGDCVEKDYKKPGAFIDEKIIEFEKSNGSTVDYFVQYDQKNKSLFVCFNCKKGLADKLINSVKPRFKAYYPEKTKIQYIFVDPSTKKATCYDNDGIEANVPNWYNAKTYDYWWK